MRLKDRMLELRDLIGYTMVVTGLVIAVVISELIRKFKDKNGRS